MRQGNAIKNREKRRSLLLRKSIAKKRRCLMCGKNFLSKGPHNRRCKKCSQKIAQAGENAFYVPKVYSTNYRVGEPSDSSD